jgi:hypothetical protein
LRFAFPLPRVGDTPPIIVPPTATPSPSGRSIESGGWGIVGGIEIKKASFARAGAFVVELHHPPNVGCAMQLPFHADL